MNIEMKKRSLLAQANEAVAHADKLSSGPSPLGADVRKRIDTLLATASSKRAQAASLKSTEEIRAEARAAAIDCGVPVDEEDFRKEFRSYLRTGVMETRTYAGLSEAGTGGDLVPQFMADNVTSMLKAIDPLFDPNVVTFVESETGTSFPCPMLSDEQQSASVVGEGGAGSELELGSFGSLLLAQAPTWRSGKFAYSVELSD